jgi:hypothetical protein
MDSLNFAATEPCKPSKGDECKICFAMPSGAIDNGLEERSALNVGDEESLSSGRSQKAMAASTFSETEAFASLLGLYLAHEMKATKRPGRYQDPNTHSAQEESGFFGSNSAE